MHMANEQYQQNNHKWKTYSWASRLWRGIELVFKSLDCFTVRPNFFQPDRLLEWSVFHFIYFHLFIYFFWGVGGGGGGGGWGWGWGVLSSNAFTIWCCIPIIRPPRVIRRFKRRSCFFLHFHSKMRALADTVRTWTRYVRRPLRWVFWNTRRRTTTMLRNWCRMSQRNTAQSAPSWWVESRSAMKLHETNSTVGWHYNVIQITWYCLQHSSDWITE